MTRQMEHPAAPATGTAPIRVPAQRVPAELRGRTVITDRAATRLVARVAESLPYVQAIVQPDGRPWTHATTAEVDGDLLRVRVFVTVAYPAPLRTTAQRIRQSVADQVSRMTGLRVPEVDVVVTHLSTGEPS